MDAETFRLNALALHVGQIISELDQIIAAEAKATQAHDRTQSALAAFFVGEPRPDLNASNDHGSAPSAPSIA